MHPRLVFAAKAIMSGRKQIHESFVANFILKYQFSVFSIGTERVIMKEIFSGG